MTKNPYLAPIRLDMAIPISVVTPNFLDAAAVFGQLLLRARKKSINDTKSAFKRVVGKTNYPKAILTPS